MGIVIFLLIVNIVMSGVATYLGMRRRKELVAQRHDITLAQFERVYNSFIGAFGEDAGIKMMKAWVVTMECLGKVITPIHSEVQRAMNHELGHGPNGLLKQMSEAPAELLTKIRFDKKLMETVAAERVVKLHKMRDCLY